MDEDFEDNDFDLLSDFNDDVLNEGDETINSVSYTHLTLPTKRIV